MSRGNGTRVSEERRRRGDGGRAEGKRGNGGYPDDHVVDVEVIVLDLREKATDRAQSGTRCTP